MLSIAVLFQWGVNVFHHTPQAHWCIYPILALQWFTNSHFHVLIIMKSVSLPCGSLIFKNQFLTSGLYVLGQGDWCDHDFWSISIHIKGILQYYYCCCYYYYYYYILFIITFIQGIYNYILETNHVCKVYVAVIRQLQFMVHVMLFTMLNVLYFHNSTFWTVCVQCPIWILFVVSWFCAFQVCCSGIFWIILGWYCCHYYTGITYDFTFNICCISTVKSLHLESSQLISWSHSCFLKMWHPLACMFLLHYHGLWRLVSC
jgi:hypothetical protein